MALPDFESKGDLPAGIHLGAIDEVIDRFGNLSPHRQAVTARLIRIYSLAQGTEYLERFIIFGSYITAKPVPNDVDVVLVMRDNFRVNACSDEMKSLLDHSQATAKWGASIFWIRPSMLLLETVESFLDQWQIKRDGSRRGIVEVKQ